MAVDPSLTGALGDVSAHVDNLQVAAAAAGNVGQSTTSALKEFTVKLPEASQMLTTTIRSAESLPAACLILYKDAAGFRSVSSKGSWFSIAYLSEHP